ncbi:MAG TPA: TonB-dependent receptor [Bryobacteraceae bacterium]|jgi:iron complex outermembrane receptor protein|nr:TonB-dependent receptor [Bryobacteraceae bacterium]
MTPRGAEIIFNTLVDLLKLDPSLDLQERTPDGVQADLSIRGGSFAQTLVLLNGMSVDDSQSGHHDMDIPVPLDSISRVEVLRGSGSTEYGSDAVAGVVNFITEPPDHLELRLRTAFGNFGTNQERVSIADSFGKLSEQAAFSRDFSTGFAPDRDYRNLQFASTTHYTSAWGASNLTLAYMDHPFGADGFYGAYPSWEDTKTWWIGYNQALGKDTDVSFAYRRHSDLYVLYRYEPEIYANHHSDESYQGALRRHQTVKQGIVVSYGAEVIHESIVSNNLGDHSRSRGAAYAALDYRAIPRFSLSLSAREEFYRKYSGEFSPTVAAGYWLTPGLKVRASASRAFRVPSYTDLYYSDPANLGNPYLKPERAWTYEGGLDWVPAGRLTAEAAFFDRRLRNGIDYYRTTPDALWQAVNIDSLNFYGVESSLRYALSRRQTVELLYTWLLGVQNTIPFAETKYNFNYPSSSGVVAWTGELPGQVIFRTRVGVLNRISESPYALWDVYAGYAKGKIHPFVQVANITSTSYQEIQGIVMPGRSITGGLEFLFKGK